MGKSILIIGEDPALIDFTASYAPKNMSAAKIMDGLNGSVARLESAGHSAGTASYAGCGNSRAPGEGCACRKAL